MVSRKAVVNLPRGQRERKSQGTGETRKGVEGVNAIRCCVEEQYMGGIHLRVLIVKGAIAAGRKARGQKRA
jgi:hypothetical protein